MQVTGKLTHKLDLITGQGKNGEWRKQSFVLEIAGDYTKSVAFDTWGDTIQYVEKANIGDTLTVEFDLESREYQGRWFTNAKAWKIVNGQNNGKQGQSNDSNSNDLPPEDNSGLPF